MHQYKATISAVIDGDTLDLFIDLGFHICAMKRVRLDGVDAPELFGVSKDSEEYRQGEAIFGVVEAWAADNPTVLVDIGKGKHEEWLAQMWPLNDLDEADDPKSLNDLVKEAIEGRVWDRPKEVVSGEEG